MLIGLGLVLARNSSDLPFSGPAVFAEVASTGTNILLNQQSIVDIIQQPPNPTLPRRIPLKPPHALRHLAPILGHDVAQRHVFRAVKQPQQRPHEYFKPIECVQEATAGSSTAASGQMPVSTFHHSQDVVV